MKRVMLAAAALVCAMAASGAARAADVDPDALSRKAAKSLVVVEYTLHNENTSHPEEGQGIVLNKEGVILISGGLISEGIPLEYVKDLKVRGPGNQFKEVPATFLGRTTNRLFAFIKADEPLNQEPLAVDATEEVKIGAQVAAVGMYSRLGGYEPYVGICRVKVVLSFAHDIALADSFGLTRATSPVYDFQTGKFVGITLPPVSETMTLTMPTGDGSNASLAVQLKDDDQSSVFLPWSEVGDVFANIPSKPFDVRRPWIGLDTSGITGVEEEVKKLYNIQQPSGVTVGSLIPGGAAEKAGIKTTDIVLAVDGKEFSNSPVPEIMVAQFQRALEKLKIGQDATLTVLRDGKKMDIKVAVLPSPKLGAEMPQSFNAKLGVTTRDLAFFDLYNRKLPQDTKGVMVALVKEGAPGSMGTTRLRTGYLVTKVNDQPVTSEKEFNDQLTKALEGTEVVFVVLLPSGESQVCRIDLTTK